MTKDEVLKLALEALEKSHICPLLPDDCSEAITAIKEALAQPEQEPFAFLHPQKGFYFAKPTKILAPTIVDVEPLALYTTPSLHKPLSDEKLKKIWYDMENIMGWYSFQEIARAIEAAHGIKGEA